MSVIGFVLRIITIKCRQKFLLRRLYPTKIGHVLKKDFIYHNYLGFLSELKQNVMFNTIQAKKNSWNFYGIKEYRKKDKYRILMFEAYILTSVNKQHILLKK